MSETAEPRRLVSFTVPGKPEPKARARTVRLPGGKVSTYTPKTTVAYEGLVRHLAAQAMAGRAPWDGPVALRLHIDLPCPASWSAKRKREAWAGDIRATKKPDADNVEKAIKDGLNRVVWCDDSQVVESQKVKRYAETPGVQVVVWQLPGRRAP